ncbi:MAG TPA: SDR family NAD(P)-dependent oxidoreductase [Kouleothrix sp.]|mgnify:CR=1 FL=1|uniref:SDR family NAD(P)-dependent oxidoreductase n=1 Tax=Kouleothrix sp. TaxID=2779161 RepID=UPI002C9F50A8|nr:SDR family NAD(P)-dependent oxidoreductase [Kouleothrix sp.]HRC75855.1 SDR family NAD(P)-dependent oxidoreductase [Kouleothrix sp.]
MHGKVCIVTGASSGLGLAIATGLARMGATLVLACRDMARGAAAQARIQAATGSQLIELMRLDLAEQQSVRDFAAAYTEKFKRLNVLVHNAAVFASHRSVTPDGIETMFATNHLGPFLLTHLLLDVLRNGALARVITITGPADTRLDLADLQSERMFHAIDAFAASRLCSQICSFELARRLDGRGVTFNLANPGLVRSNLMREAPGLVRWLWRVAAASPERAARTAIYLASSREVAGVTGKLFKGRRQVAPAHATRDPELRRKVWELSMELAQVVG